MHGRVEIQLQEISSLETDEMNSSIQEKVIGTILQEVG
jgi:hypothetical protein